MFALFARNAAIWLVNFAHRMDLAKISDTFRRPRWRNSWFPRRCDCRARLPIGFGWPWRMRTQTTDWTYRSTLDTCCLSSTCAVGRENRIRRIKALQKCVSDVAFNLCAWNVTSSTRSSAACAINWFKCRWSSFCMNNIPKKLGKSSQVNPVVMFRLTLGSLLLVNSVSNSGLSLWPTIAK